MSLARLSLFKEYMKDSGTTYDDVYKVLLEGATERLESLIGHNLEQTTYTDERHSGTNSRKIFLRHYPVIAVTTVKEDDVVVGTACYSLVDSRYLLYEAGSTWEKVVTEEETEDVYDGGWDKGVENFKITYQAGYDVSHAYTCPAEEPIPASYTWTVPRDVEFAIVEMAAMAWLNSKMGEGRLGLGSIGRAGTSEGMFRFDEGLPNSAKNVIEQYRGLDV